ncbi:MAG: hypothetical protein AAF630_17865, partial [Cyanobacteria bacterium P01_C01_bin.38]
PLDRFLPDDRSTVLEDKLASAKPDVITQAAQEWQQNAPNDTLLVNARYTNRARFSPKQKVFFENQDSPKLQATKNPAF